MDFRKFYNKYKKEWIGLPLVHGELELFERIKKKSNKDFIILDLGSGGGKLSLQIAPLFNRVYGIDFSEELVREARKYASIKGHQNVLYTISDLRKRFHFDNGFFNGVVSNFVISKASCPAEICLNEAFRVLKRKGFLIILCRSDRDPEELGCNNIGGYRKEEMLTILKGIGYKGVRIDTLRYKRYYPDKNSVVFHYQKTGLKRFYEKNGMWKNLIDNIGNDKKSFFSRRNLLLVEARKN